MAFPTITPAFSKAVRTPLENWLRQLGTEAGYTGGFLEHYLLALLYPAGLTRTVQLTLGAVVLAVNLPLYWRVYSRSRYMFPLV